MIDLLENIPQEEISKVPEVVLSHIKDKCAENTNTISNLRSELEKSKVFTAQQRFQFDKELNSLRKLFEEQGSQKSVAELNLSTVTEKSSGLECDLNKANERINQLLLKLEVCQNEQENKSSQSAAIAGNLEAKERLISELKQQICDLQEKLIKAHKEKSNALIETEKANTIKVQYEYKEQRNDQEKSFLKDQIEILHRQLEERANEALNFRSDNTTKIINLESQLCHLREELKLVREELTAKEKLVGEKTSKIEELLQALNEARVSEMNQEETLKKELNAQDRLCSIYKGTNEDQQKRIEELEKCTEELRQLLQESSEQFGALEAAKKSAEEDAQNQINMSNNMVKELKEENDRINSLLESSAKKDDAMFEMSPAASAANHLIKKGLTLSQLYSEYMSATEKLINVEAENKRLTRYVHQILREIEEKAPLLSKQKEDYHRALETIDTLHNQIDDHVEELQKQKLDSEDSHRRAAILGRENEKLNLQVKDLSKQVSVLLVQIDAAKSGLPDPSDALFGESMDFISSDDLISSRLVTFRNATEMQARNAELLVSIRELSSQLETVEKTAVESRTRSLQKELKMAYEELEELRQSRQRLQNMIDSITKERDLYKTMNGDSSFIQQISPKDASTPRVSQRQVVELKEIEKLTVELERLNKEFSDYKREKAANGELEKRERDNLNARYEESRKENVKLLSHAEYNNERLKNTNSNNDTLQRTIKGLEKQCDTLRKNEGRYENESSNLTKRLRDISNQSAKLEALSEHLRKENTMLKEAEVRHLSEIENLRRNSSSQEKIYANLELIKTNLERTDCESKIRLENQVVELSNQCARLKVKLESNNDLKDAQLQIVKLEESLKESRNECVKMKDDLKVAENNLNIAKAQIAEMEKSRQVVSSPVINRSRLSPSTIPSRTGIMGQTVRELEVQLTEERAKTERLQATVDSLTVNCNMLKETCKQQEEKIGSAKDANDNAQNMIEQLRDEQEKLKKIQEETMVNLKKAEESEKACRDSLNHDLEKLSIELEDKQREINEMNVKIEAMKEKECNILAQLKEQRDLCSEAQKNYEKEVILHGSAIQAAASNKEKLSQCNAKIEAAINDKEKAENLLKEKESNFEKCEGDYTKEIEALKQRSEEMDEQNKNLVLQFTQLSDKMSALQNKLSQGENGQAPVSEEDTRTTDQLREVIKYLRREKEIATGRVELAEASVERIQSRKDHLETQLDSVRKDLAQEREKNLASTENTPQYAELVRKSQTHDALADSNKMLRDETENLRNMLEETKAKNSSLEKDISPLIEKNKELVASNDSLSDLKKAVENEKEMYKNRTQELVEKLNKAKPEDMVKLQNELAHAQKLGESKDHEISRLKTFSAHLQKSQQSIMTMKNQIQADRDSAREDNKKSSEERKRMEQEKITLRKQIMQLTERSKLVDSQKQANVILQQETKKYQDQLKQYQSEISNYQRKIEATEEKFKAQVKTCNQLRLIAKKYKKESDTADKKKQEEPETGDIADDKGTPSKERVDQLQDEISELKSRNESLQQEIDKLQSSNSRSEENEDNSGRMSEEDLWKMKALESKVKMNEKEKEEHALQLENLQKKLSMQQKVIENMQKQAASVSKASPVVLEKTNTETPPTANIKPMAAPQAAARNQTPQVSGPSRLIPTASIRPMAPSSQSSIVMVSPLETQISGDGAVSSTVTLPQATVTPTPAVPTSTASLSFPSALTATVSPTPVSSSIAMSGYPQHPQHSGIGTTQSPGESEELRNTDEEMPQERAVASGSGEAVHEEESDSSQDAKEQPAPSSQKRKLEVILEEHEEEDEENKRARQEDDSGEPSSSSNLKKHQSEELIVLPSDDEEMIQQSDENNSLIIASVQGGSEAQLRIIEEGSQDADDQAQVQSSAPQALNEEPSSSRHFPQQQFDEGSQDRIVPSTPTIQNQSSDAVSSVPSQDFVSGVSQSSDSVGQSGHLSHLADGGIIDAESVQLDEQAASDNVSSDGNISSSAGEGSRTEPEAMPSVPEQPMCSSDSPTKHEEPDSGVEELESVDVHPEDQEVVELEEQEQPTDEELRQDEDSQSSLSEDASSASPRNLRSVRDSSRRITPISWEAGSRGARARGRGSGQPSTRGRQQTTRGTAAVKGQRARRSRPGYNRG